jgi:hypothetical protein
MGERQFPIWGSILRRIEETKRHLKEPRFFHFSFARAEGRKMFTGAAGSGFAWVRYTGGMGAGARNGREVTGAAEQKKSRAFS